MIIIEVGTDQGKGHSQEHYSNGRDRSSSNR